MGSTETKAKRTTRGSRSTAGDAFVVLAMTLTTVALAIGLYLQFRLAFWLAVVAALSVYVGLLALHVLVRRSERVEHLTAEIQRLEAELSQVATVGTTAAAGKPGVAAKTPTQGPVPAAPAVMPGPAPQQGAIPAGPAGVAIGGIGTMLPRQISPHAPQAIATQAPAALAPILQAPVLQAPVLQAQAPSAATSQISPAAGGLAPPPAGKDTPQDMRMPQSAAPQSAPPQSAAVSGRTSVAGGPPPAATETAGRSAERPGMSDRAVDAIMNDYWAFRPAQSPQLPEPPPGHPAASAERFANIATGDVSPAGAPPVVPVNASAPQPPLPAPESNAAAVRDASPRSAVPPPIPAARPVVPSSPRQSDVEMIGGLIKKMADEISAVEAGRLRNPTGIDRVPPAAIETSVNALRTTADQMRMPAAAAPPPLPVTPPSAPRQVAPTVPAPVARHAMERSAARTLPPLDMASAGEAGGFASMPWHEVVDTDAGHARGAPSASEIMVPASPGQPPPVAHSRLAALAEAITAGRLDVLLDPILGLADQRARHFEVSVRLRDKTGNVLEPPDGVPELRESGLLPLLDCARIQRSAQVASRLADRGKPGSLFSAFSGESLSHDQFLSDFADLYSAREGLSAQLVLSFGQADVRAFAGRDWDTIAEMHELGFRFALQAVTDLDFDLEALKAAGFDFVKLDASVFLDGMPASGGVIPAADICRHLAQLGMTLIVGRIDDDTQLARIFGFGVIYGQGQLFGGARPMKSEALAEVNSGHAAA